MKLVSRSRDPLPPPEQFSVHMSVVPMKLFGFWDLSQFENDLN